MNGQITNTAARLFGVLTLLTMSSCTTQKAAMAGNDQGAWQDDFGLSSRTLLPSGRNPCFILEPGFELTFEDGHSKVIKKVLRDTKTIAGVETRIVEEREWHDGKLAEVSRNYFAICAKTKDVFYFGEDVDEYEDGKVVGHAGTWHAGENGARAGLIMPGEPRLGMKFCQEVAPGVAMDRAEIVGLDETIKTPAGTFSGCLKTKEGSALNPLEREYKIFAPGIGLVKEADLLLTRHTP